ncbi:carboxypeptidase regulatory-like domain-containing protein [Martelella endophytica]|nr:carboxypeptidase regulatory-like domain-containing protein [Martelella endophytica]
MRPALALLVTLIAATGCVTAPEPKTAFNADEAAFVHAEGRNTITGQAFLRRNDGVVVYAAGSDVHLIPKTAYSTERMDGIYRGAKINTYIQSPPMPDGYLAAMRDTRADGEGRFAFAGVADGSYYIVTTVEWLVGYTPQGGNLMEEVSVKGGETRDIIMTGR